MRQPPAFATNEGCWNYTKNKMQMQTDRTYDQWIGKDFAAATVIYRNSMKKYGENGFADLGIENPCPKCEENEVMDGDYLCESCRFG